MPNEVGSLQIDYRHEDHTQVIFVFFFSRLSHHHHHLDLFESHVHPAAVAAAVYLAYEVDS